MWWKLIVIVIFWTCICGYWDEKVQKRRDKKRLYKFLMGITYLATAAVAVLLAKYGGNVLYIYVLGGVVFGIGSLLSAINCNIREMYAMFLVYGFIMLLIAPYFSKHKIIVTSADVVLVIVFINACIESIRNIRNGIDIDLIREQEEKDKKWKKRFKLARLLMGMWFRG